MELGFEFCEQTQGIQIKRVILLHDYSFELKMHSRNV